MQAHYYYYYAILDVLILYITCSLSNALSMETLKLMYII